MTRAGKPENERKGVSILVRCTKTSRDRYKAVAAKAGLSLSDWLRGLADKAAGKGK